MNTRILPLAALAAAGLLTTTSARADFINFDSDPQQFVPNGFVSVDSANVSFSDSQGADLAVFDFTPQSALNGLAVFGDDTSLLLMTFTGSTATLSLEFGNDDPTVSQPGDVAVLQTFVGATLVSETTVVLNNDDVLNQSISAGPGAFDNAIFYYGRPVTGGGSPDPIGLIEVVDNIRFDVPEPTSLALAGLGGLTLLRRRR